MKVLNFKFYRYSFLSMIGMFIFLSSCNKNEAPEDIPLDNQEVFERNSNFQLIASNRLEFAKYLSIAIAKDPQINEVVSEMISDEQAKGYYASEIFFNLKKSKTSKSSKGSTLQDALSSLVPEIKNSMNYLEQNDPGFAILMLNPKKASKFNTRVFIDNGTFDDMNPNSIIEFYDDGVKGSQTLAEEPNAISFIVRRSEAFITPEIARLDGLGTDQLTFLGNVGGNDIRAIGYNTANNLSVAKSIKGNGSVSNKPVHDRDKWSGKDKIQEYQLTRSHDVWDDFDELRFDVIWAEGELGHITYYEQTMQGYTSRPGWELFTWDPEDHSKMKYKITERDWGWNVEVTLTVPGFPGSIKVTHQSEDDPVGEGIVEYEDPLYNENQHHWMWAGDVKFKIAATGDYINDSGNGVSYNVRFQSVTDGDYLRAKNQGWSPADCRVRPEHVGAYENFTLEMNEADNTFALKGYNGKYADVDRSSDGRIKFTNDNPMDPDCRFRFIDLGNGIKAIQFTGNNLYLSCEGPYDAQDVRANRRDRGDWERWRVHY